MTSMLSRLSLRQRIAVAVGLSSFLLTVMFGGTSWAFAISNLEEASDDDLRTAARVVEQIIDQQPTAVDGVPLPGPFGEGAFDDGTGTGYRQLQVLAADGSVLGGDNLPVSDEAAALFGEPDTELFEDVEINGRRLRVLTVGIDGDAAAPNGPAAIQVAQDVTDLVEGLRRARVGGLVIGILSGLAAALLAWLISGRLVAPVKSVADAADRIRLDQELPDRLEANGLGADSSGSKDDLGRLVNSFNGMLDELRSSRAKQERLVADVGHELRTPLTSLRVKTEFLQSQPNLPAEDRQRLVDGSVTELESLTSLVQELLALATDRAPTEEAPVLTELSELVATQVADFRSTSGRTVNVDAASGVVETRPKQVRRALSNLLTNAHKYSPTDQPIDVTVSGSRIEVRDYGPGIPEVERVRVFDRFHRGTQHQSIEGSGLGLAIVAAIAEANGGVTWIRDPEVGEGVVVGFTVGPTVSPPTP